MRKGFPCITGKPFFKLWFRVNKRTPGGRPYKFLSVGKADTINSAFRTPNYYCVTNGCTGSPFLPKSVTSA